MTDMTTISQGANNMMGMAMGYDGSFVSDSSESGGAGTNVHPFWVDVCGALAPIASIVVFLAPMPTIRKIQREQDVRALPLLPYTSMIASCFLWTTYGVLKQAPNIWGSNMIGFLLGSYYTANFLPHVHVKFDVPSATLPGSMKQHLQIVGMTIVSTLALAFLFPLETAQQYIGYAGIGFCLVLFASPLAALSTVIRDKSANSIPLPFTVACTLNCVFWTMWGIFAMNDFAVYFPNSLGLLFGLAQLALKLYYGKGKKDDDSDGPIGVGDAEDDALGAESLLDAANDGMSIGSKGDLSEKLLA